MKLPKFKNRCTLAETLLVVELCSKKAGPGNLSVKTNHKKGSRNMKIEDFHITHIIKLARGDVERAYKFVTKRIVH